MADSGFGVTITFASGFMAEITNVSWDGIARDPLETSHSTTTDGWRTFIPSDLKDPGTLEVTLRFDPTDAPPISSAGETVTVAIPGKSWSCSGFLTNFSATIPYDEIMEATASLKFTGTPNFNVT